MTEILFASNNQDKIRELRNIVRELGLSDEYSILCLSDINLEIHVEENMPTLEENAVKKAKEVYRELKKMSKDYLVIAEDFGFFVEDRPEIAGIKSKRWFDGTESERNEEVLRIMKDDENRKCYYKSVFSICDENSERVFGGYTYGTVATEQRGTNGFAYDPIFELEDGRTIAELQPEEKDAISSRTEAFEYLMKNI